MEWTDNYFDWEVPGIGRNIFFFMLDGILGIIVLVMVEYRVFERMMYYMQRRHAATRSSKSNIILIAVIITCYFYDACVIYKLRNLLNFYIYIY